MSTVQNNENEVHNWEQRLGDSETLILHFNNIGREGAAALATALTTNTTLTTLDLYGNNIGAEGAAALATALTTNTILTTLNLCWNGIGAEGAAALARALTTNTSLTTLDLGSNGIGTAQLDLVETQLERNRALRKEAEAIENIFQMILSSNDKSCVGIFKQVF